MKQNNCFTFWVLLLVTGYFRLIAQPILLKTILLKYTKMVTTTFFSFLSLLSPHTSLHLLNLFTSLILTDSFLLFLAFYCGSCIVVLPPCLKNCAPIAALTSSACKLVQNFKERGQTMITSHNKKLKIASNSWLRALHSRAISS